MPEFSTTSPGQYRLIMRRNGRNPILIKAGKKSDVVFSYDHFKRDLWEGYEMILVDWRGCICE